MVISKQELQSALIVETAIREANKQRFEEELLGPTQFWSVDWQSEQRIEAIYKAAANCGWNLEL